MALLAWMKCDSSLAIHKAMNNDPTIDWSLEHQEEIVHKCYQKGLEGTL